MVNEMKNPSSLRIKLDLGMEDDGKIQRSVTFSYSSFEVVPTEN